MKDICLALLIAVLLIFALAGLASAQQPVIAPPQPIPGYVGPLGFFYPTPYGYQVQPVIVRLPFRPWLMQQRFVYVPQAPPQSR